MALANLTSVPSVLPASDKLDVKNVEIYISGSKYSAVKNT